ncbi:MAG: hypothetical protein E7F65_00245 [Alloscardovia omnicolens]|nr:hypothetical protein [Alloscardovia omnicolens]
MDTLERFHAYTMVRDDPNGWDYLTPAERREVVHYIRTKDLTIPHISEFMHAQERDTAHALMDKALHSSTATCEHSEAKQPRVGTPEPESEPEPTYDNVVVLGSVIASPEEVKTIQKTVRYSHDLVRAWCENHPGQWLMYFNMFDHQDTLDKFIYDRTRNPKRRYQSDKGSYAFRQVIDDNGDMRVAVCFTPHKDK